MKKTNILAINVWFLSSIKECVYTYQNNQACHDYTVENSCRPVLAHSDRKIWLPKRNTITQFIRSGVDP